MDALTAKTNEIRRLHAVCRAQHDAVRQAYLQQIKAARQLNHQMIALDLTRQCRQRLRSCRQSYLYAARVLKKILAEIEA